MRFLYHKSSWKHKCQVDFSKKMVEENSQKSLKGHSSTSAKMRSSVGRNSAQLSGTAECRNSVHLEPSLPNTSHSNSQNVYERMTSFEFIMNLLDGSWRGVSAQKNAETNGVMKVTHSPSRMVTSEATNITVGSNCSQKML